MSETKKYKCIYDLKRKCISIPNGYMCGHFCVMAYTQGKKDATSECLKLVKKYQDEFEI